MTSDYEYEVNKAQEAFARLKKADCPELREQILDTMNVSEFAPWLFVFRHDSELHRLMNDKVENYLADLQRREEYGD